MTLRTVCALAAGLMVVAVGRSDDKADADVKAVQGEWTVEKVQEDGKWKLDREKPGTPVTIAEKKITVRDENNSWEVLYKLDPAAKPKAIEITPTVGEFTNKASKGLYKLDGDTLTIVYGIPTREAPTEFATKEGSRQIMFVLKRGKGK
jgi:uncharacterized protein (TIGR03067 family)